jgi:GT2 family glycosyltransferase
VDASVVIPTFNRRDTLAETLRVLSAADYPARSWEIVVVDDGSTDGTGEALRSLATRTAVSVRHLAQANGGPARARNAGAAAAEGGTLIFLDDDISVAPDFVARHISALEQNPGCWIVGKIANPPEIRDTPFGRYRDDLSEGFQAVPSGAPTDTDLITAANLSMPRADFHRLGGFDRDFASASCEDMMLGLRARAAGIRILFDPRICVTHRDWATDLPRLCERQRLYATSDVLLWRKLGALSPRQLVIEANGPVRWGREGASTTAKKIAKFLLAPPPGSALVQALGRVAETLAPDSRASRRLYDAAIALAVFRGVREGLRRYPRPQA